MRIKAGSGAAGLFLALVVTGQASAQADLTGYWYPVFHEDQLERGPGPERGDYLGLPINDAARQRGDSWDPNLLTVPEHQCKPHPSTYGFRGVQQIRIWEDRDPNTQQLIKLHTQIQWQEQRRQIWMDGRGHPPEYAAHTWQGFSTGRWEGDVLVVRTTHLKAGYLRRNGIALSDRAWMEDRFYRHGDVLTHVTYIEDPVYLSEPIVRSNNYRLNVNGNIGPYPCRYAIEIPRPRGVIPHVLPGQNTSTQEFAERHNIPIQAVRGGAETALPEFLDTLAGTRR